MILEINASTLDSIQIIKIATDITAFQFLARLRKMPWEFWRSSDLPHSPTWCKCFWQVSFMFSYPCVRFLHTRATPKYSRVYLCFVGCASHSSAEHLSLL